MRRKIRKPLAILLSMVMLIGILPVFSTAADDDIDYTINSPYENVDWDTYNQYKTSLHNHSTVSDGDNEFGDMVRKHYEQGYDVLAMTDHSTTDRGWVDVNFVPAIRTLMSMTLTPPKGLTQSEYDAMQNGEDLYGTERGGNKMLRVPFGNELNGASFNNTHVNTWFADYGNGVLGATSDYETGLKGVEEAGGLSVINHPGEYTNQRDVMNPDDAYEGGLDNYYVKKFANLLINYNSCLGIDINSKNDTRTKNDRKLWDLLLQSVVPTGRNVYAIATSDAHRLNVLGAGWVVTLMPENTVDNLRSSMEAGEFFSLSMYNKNTKELSFLKEQLGDKISLSMNGSNYEWTAENTVTEDEIKVVTNPAPVVNRITVDDADDTISIDADNQEIIYWIANGEIIHVGATIDLDDYSDEIGSYVRAEMWGEGGILYTQAFMLDYEGAPGADVDDSFIDYGSWIGRIWAWIINLIRNNPLFDLLLGKAFAN